MWEQIIQLDKDLFLFFNQFHSTFFDTLMWWISDKYIWIPLYALLLFLVFYYKRKQGIIIIFFIALLVTLTDQTSVHWFKEVFERLRPCHDPDLAGLVHTVNNKCGGQFGFVSSHASNTFGIAVFLSLLLTAHIRWIGWPLIIWAAIVSYSRIYLGVHFPGDILGGALLGTFWGLIIYYLYLFTKYQFFRKFA
ncbi:MAG: phosphatase PAP2 family protein [Bacteroidales bacterium]|nr:phosphatase PAP2 family protein [Bacteroidales bacterium]